MMAVRSNLTRAWLGMAALALAGCGEDPAGLGGGPAVAIQFGAPAPALASAALGAQAVGAPAGSLTIEGTNGVLTLTDVRLIVSEFELKRAAVDCDDAVNEDECEEFAIPPYFLDLPLDGGAAQAVRQEVPAGTYSKIEFEVEDVEVDDDEDSAKSQEIQSLLAAVRSEFPDWPEEASVRVTGTFTPTGGEPVAFRAYFKAEIEIELDFEPPFTIGEADADKAVTIELDPVVWFRRADGSVIDLSQADFDATGTVIEFELEMERGFGKVEFEDD